jgi:7-cyano-7-deazaguanine synthase
MHATLPVCAERHRARLVQRCYGVELGADLRRKARTRPLMMALGPGRTGISAQVDRSPANPAARPAGIVRGICYIEPMTRIAGQTPLTGETDTQTAGRLAVVLLSGGLDSATVLAIARSEGYALYALSFRYGQRHSVELEAAHRVAAASCVARHVMADIDLRVFGGSALTDNIDVPHREAADELGDEIPVTYVPARNTIFLSYALAWAETLGCSDVFIGVNAVDYGGYPDCRPEYIQAFEQMANLATKAGVEGRQQLKIHTPLIELTKAQVIERGLTLGVDYSLTHSCYDPDPAGRPCGSCDSCLLRHRGFAELGLADPALAPAVPEQAV